MPSGDAHPSKPGETLPVTASTTPAAMPDAARAFRGRPGRLTRIARIWAFVAAVSAAAAAFPFVFEDLLSFDDGGGALMVFGFLGAVSGIITALVYARMGREESRILSDPSRIVARWEMDRSEWTRMVEAIARARSEETAGSFRLLLAGCAVAAIPSFLLTSFAFTIIFIPALIAVMFLISRAVPRFQRRRLLRSGGIVIIAKDAVLRGTEFHPFTLAGNRFEDLTWDGSRLRFIYSSATRLGRQEHELIVDVPERERCRVPAILEAYGGRSSTLPPLMRAD